MGKPLTITYKSTNHFLVDCRNGKLLIDAGWAGSLPELRAGLRRYDLPLSAITYVMMTHHHPDHAGLTQEVKRMSGARMLIHERQIPFLSALAEFYAGKGGYEPILVDRDDIVVSGDGREILASIGIQGAMIETPGHSDDSISLVLDDGSAFIGDLRLAHQVPEYQQEAIAACWQKLISLQVHIAYPSHTDPFRLGG